MISPCALRDQRPAHVAVASPPHYTFSKPNEKPAVDLMFLAIFPLQLALFPGEAIPLHIFEPRYRQLIAECRDEGIHFGIPTYAQGNLAAYATEVELVKIVKTYDTGEMDIIVRGVRVFHIVEVQQEVPNKLYSGAKVEYPENDPAFDEDTRTKVFEKFEEVFKLVGEKKPEIDENAYGLAYAIAPHVGLALWQRVELISTPAERKRQDFLLAHLEKALKAIREQKGPKTIARSNGNGKSNGNGHVKL